MIKLEFDNRFTNELPADPDERNVTRQVTGACFSRVRPRAAAKPTLLAHSREAAALIGLTDDDCLKPEFTELFVGNRLHEGMDPFAMCYGGHQFGNWAGQLGDGRAIGLGEAVYNGQHWALQLKGAGETPYSRTADGLAVLRSSVREFLCSEAMHHLGVPTTRALSLIGTGERVLRDMFYDGNAKMEPGAVVCRMAPSFMRFGNFQIFASRGDTENLQRLTDFTLRHYFAHLMPASGVADGPSIAAMFKEICDRTADMIIEWMRVGFVHGVMNTDNMSIHGLTIDYGPYGWLENYDPDWTPNTTDAHGRRYRFANQPGIAQWNLFQLANAWVSLTSDPTPLEEAIAGFADRYQHGYQRMMAAKIGLPDDQVDDGQLIAALEQMLKTVQPDMTLFFRLLADWSDAQPAAFHFADALYETLDQTHLGQLNDWLGRYADRVSTVDAQQRRTEMNRVNPLYVLRNWLAQEAIDLAEQGDYSRIHKLLDVLRMPYEPQPGCEHFANKRPDWAIAKAGCSMLSCSS